MKAILFDGSQANDSVGQRVIGALEAELQERGWQTERFLLREAKIGPCAGDFFCWVRNPGVCNIADDNRAIAAAIVSSDLLVYITPLTFGGYSSTLKSMVDHQIQNISPFFTQISGEIHHQRRYPKYPDFLAVGWLEAPDPQAEAVFRHLAARNALNMYAKTTVSGLAWAGQDDLALRAATSQWMDDLQAGKSSRVGSLPQFEPPQSRAAPPQSGLLLVGSPRTRQSTSNSLGSYLYERLGAGGVQAETMYIHTTIRSMERFQALVKAVQAADLVTLAFPLYVDSLPAPVIEALERIAAQRTGQKDGGKLQKFAAIVNCGFPEAKHTANALAVCATFARQAGFAWVGGLALGGGEGMVHGASLAELGGRAIPLRQSLDLAAEALLAGDPIPQAAQALIEKPFIPSWLYRIFGGYGWRQQAKRWGMQRELMRRPYLDHK